MIEKLERNKDLLARGKGFYDSVYPVIYCDRDMYVVDMNKTAVERFEAKLKYRKFSAHLTEEDLKKVTFLLETGKGEGTLGLYVETGVVKMRGARYALVAAFDYFGERFAEIRLFRSRREMLSSYDSRKLMFPVEPVFVDYSLLKNRVGNEETGAELNRVFSYNMLSHIYEMACSESEIPELFDLRETLTRIVSEVSHSFKFNSRRWSVSYMGANKFAFPVMSRKNFINLIAFEIYIISKISNGEKSRAIVKQRKERAEIEFSTTLTRSRIKKRGDIVYSYIGTMYPQVRTAAKLVEFICNLYGIGCYAEISKNFTLIVRLVLTDRDIADTGSVKHRKRFDMASVREAVSFIRLLEKLDGAEKDPE